ncbi:MAG: GNAT family N-acetyltransferase [Dietzia sp.]
MTRGTAPGVGGPEAVVDLRPLRVDDAALVAEATLFNVNWTGEERVTPAVVASDPALAHYTVLRPDRGDFGLVAEVGGRPVGVVWLLFLDAADPGYGYVADGVPELSVCVWPGHRGRGLGTLLLEAALAAARDRDLDRVCLSVEAGNPARRLYRDLGFVDVEGTASETMVIRLRM